MGKTSDEVIRDPPICRTCLCIITGNSYRLHENSGLGNGLKYTHILRTIVPDLYISLCNGSEICLPCKDSLITSYKFKEKCLETENLILNYLRNEKCADKVLELSSVIRHLKMDKMKATAQTILSEWNEDSCEEPNNSENTVQPILQVIQTTIHPSNNPSSGQQLTDTVKALVNNSREMLKSTANSHQLVPPLVPIIPITRDENDKVYTGKQKLKDTNTHDLEIVKIKEEKDDFEQENTIQNQTNVDKDQIPVSCNSTPVTGTEENVLGICEETGFLKDQNGHYFDYYGNALEKEEIEAERKKVSDKGFFTISKIFSLNEAHKEITDKEQNENNLDLDVEENIAKHELSVVKKDAGKAVQKSRENTVIATARNNNSHKLPTLAPKPNMYIRPVNINNLLAKEHRRLSNIEVAPHFLAENITPENHELNQPLEVYSLTNNFPCIAASTDTDYPEIKIEPMDDFTHIDEDTLSTPEESPDLQKIMLDLDNIEDNQYVDVPEFIKIHNYSIAKVVKKSSKFVPMQLQKVAKRDSNSLASSKSIIKLPTSVFRGLNTPITKLENQISESSFLQYQDNENTCFNANTPTILKGLLKQPDGTSTYVTTEVVPKRDVPGYKVFNHGISAITSNRSLKPTTQTGPEGSVSGKKKMRIKQVDGVFKKSIKNTSVKSKDPKGTYECQWEPMFSDISPMQYNPRGDFICDHDYLEAPYIRSGVLHKVDKVVLLSCFICGFVHTLDTHIRHMNQHSCVCEICKSDFQNPFMLNAHMKSHKVACKKCGVNVPVGLQSEHALGHSREENFQSHVQTLLKKVPRKRKRPNSRRSQLVGNKPNIKPSTSENKNQKIEIKKEKENEKPPSNPKRLNPYVQLTDVLLTHPDAVDTVPLSQRVVNKNHKKVDNINANEGSDTPDHDSEQDFIVRSPRKRRKTERKIQENKTKP